jgi:hypothetical protein
LLGARHTAVIAALIVMAALVIGELKTWSIRRGGSKVDIAVLSVHAYAHEAYPIWHVAHPDRACPASLTELGPYMAHHDVKDPWGSPYELYCGTDGIIVHSRGEDALPSTADDLWSNP